MKGNNKRIAKNTLLLYSRMIVVSIVALFTTRVSLKILGVEDFGIYNVVAGAIGFMGVLNGAMVSATQRFLSFELGRNNFKRYNQVFNMLFLTFLSFAVVILLIATAMQGWVINHFLVIPPARLHVARWLYYFSVFSFVLNLASIPYMSSIVAHEKMGVYAYIGLAEVILKLLIVYALYASSFDKLITYGCLMMAVTVITTACYRYYCIKKLQGCKLKFYWEPAMFRNLMSYMGWNLFGSITSIMNVQGQSIILNIFFGPVVNAAKAIADKINTIVASFSTNFYMAVRPQIIKNYAAGNRGYVIRLVYTISKFSFYLLFVIAWPLIVSMKQILVLWLGKAQVSNDMVIFSQWILVFSLVNVFEQPITVMIQSTGKIRNYEIVIGICTLLFLPLCYLSFKWGAPAYVSLIILSGIYAIAQVLRLLIAKSQMGFSIKLYVIRVAWPICLSVVPAVLLSYYSGRLLPGGVVGLFTSVFVCFIIPVVFIYFLGINAGEKAILAEQVSKRISKLKSKIHH